MPDPVALLIFLATMTLVLVQPGKLPVAVPACGGALLSILLGRTSGADILQVLALTWDAVLTLVGLVLFCTALQANGFFRWAALHVVRRAHGDGRALLWWLIGLTALVAAVLANDGAVLIMTPLTWTLVEVLGIEPRSRFAYLFAVGFVCDAGSTPLLVSNLTNILFADSFGLDFPNFAAAMLLPTLLVLVTTGLILTLLFWRDLPVSYAADPQIQPSQAIHDRQVFVADWLALTCLAAAYLGAAALHLPVALAVLPVSVALLALTLARRLLTPRTVLSEGPWAIVFFAVGIFIVVLSLFRGDWLAPVQPLLAGWGRAGNATGVGLLIGGLSAALNNLPAGLLAILGIKAAALPAALLPKAVYASILGTNIGCKLTPVGSLSTLLWLGLLREWGLKIGWGQYLLYSVPSTLAVLLAGLIGLG